VDSRIFPKRLALLDAEVEQESRQVVTYSPSTGLALVMVAVAVGLTLVPEFYYLRDNFGVRINTIFKFYYQAWVLFSISSAYAIYAMVFDADMRPSVVVRLAFIVVTVVVIASGMLFPILGNYTHSLVETSRASGNNTRPLTIDGGTTLVGSIDYESIMCWQKQLGDKQIVVVEALGGAYDPNFGRVAGLTGVPLLLGWENHESQWRGTTYPEIVGTRGTDIPSLYTDVRWETARSILQQYGIGYIFYGSSERSKYGSAGEEKFIDHLQPVCAVNDDSGQAASVFYRVDSSALVANNE
jgi:uncharacterized membrane protein